MPRPAPDPSVAVVLPGCRDLIRSGGMAQSPEAQFCSGLIDGLLYVGELLPAEYSYCVPLDIPRDQIVGAIVEEIEAVYPAVNRQHFRGLALEVLHYRWRCRDLPHDRGEIVRSP